VQATAAPAQASAGELAADLYAIFAHVFTSSSRDFLELITELDLSLSQLKLLHFAAEDDEPTLKDLSEQLGLSLAAVSRAVEGLHQRELIARREDAEDRRMKRVAATAAGRDVLDRLREHRLAGIEAFAATLTDTERARLRKALAPIVAREDIAAGRPDGETR
jgi:DNA-binding MarR family transcriptional regulator